MPTSTEGNSVSVYCEGLNLLSKGIVILLYPYYNGGKETKKSALLKHLTTVNNLHLSIYGHLENSLLLTLSFRIRYKFAFPNIVSGIINMWSEFQIQIQNSKWYIWNLDGGSRVSYICNLF